LLADMTLAAEMILLACADVLQQIRQPSRGCSSSGKIYSGLFGKPNDFRPPRVLVVGSVTGHTRCRIPRLWSEVVAPRDIAIFQTLSRLVRTSGARASSSSSSTRMLRSLMNCFCCASVKGPIKRR